MKLANPFYRIARPLNDQTSYVYGYNDEQSYIADNRYADDRLHLIRAYHIIEQDFKKLLEYIEPSDANLPTFSFRTYELLLRASTEFEANAKGILIANGYNKSKLNIHDYHKLDQAMKLSEYELYINIWDTGIKTVKPFADWAKGPSLSWYQAYNDVKHNRKSSFNQASFANCLNAIGAVYCIVFAQFNMFLYTQYQHFPTGFVDSTNRLMSPVSDMLFSTKVPHWPEADMYDFNWPQLRTTTSPFIQFQF